MMPGSLLALVIATGAFGLIAAGIGLLSRGAPNVVQATTIRGETIELYGSGLYRYDTPFIAGNNLGSDVVTVILAVPLLGVAASLSMRGSARGRFLLLGALGFFVYIGAGYALGAVAYNELFLIYVALLSASVFALIHAFVWMEHERVVISDAMPRRRIGSFMIASGLLTLAIWTTEPVKSLLTGIPPKYLDSYATIFTNAFDMAIIVPAALTAGWLILRKRLLGYAVASTLLVLEAFLLPMIAIGTVAQTGSGIRFTAGEVIGPIVGFGILAVVSGWIIVTILRNVGRAPVDHGRAN